MTHFNEFKKILLISMLPGLGKSTIAKTHKHIIDYEDWMEDRGLKYKDSNDRTAWNHLSEMLLMAEDVTEDESTLYVFSSIHWEDMNEPRLKTGLFIYMKEDLYDCDEVTLRGRPDLCKFKDELQKWNSDYDFIKGDTASIQLDTEQYVNINDIKSKCSEDNTLDIQDGIEIILDVRREFL